MVRNPFTRTSQIDVPGFEVRDDAVTDVSTGIVQRRRANVVLRRPYRDLTAAQIDAVAVNAVRWALKAYPSGRGQPPVGIVFVFIHESWDDADRRPAVARARYVRHGLKGGVPLVAWRGVHGTSEVPVRKGMVTVARETPCAGS